MGKRTEWDHAELAEEIARQGGNLTWAARELSKAFPDREKVSRQNLQTWVNDDEHRAWGAEAADQMDQHDLLRKNRYLTNTNNALRREMRNLLDASLTKGDVLSSIRTAIDDNQPIIPELPILQQQHGRRITIEVLFSDIQIGKLMDDYDSEVAQRRADEWIEVVATRILAYQQQGFFIERIIFAVLGDIIESDKKHANSGRGCDIGTADQMKIGIEIMFNKAVLTLAQFGAELDVIMITGNHDHDDHGLNMFYPGREHLSWPMYHSVRMLAEASGLNANFIIPEGSYHVHELYGQNILYEHGVRVSTSEAAMRKHVSSRIDQQKQYIDLFRMGDKHNICRFNNDRYAVNGAFFGDSRKGEEYSGIAGYDGEPAQLMFAHVNRSDNRRTSIFDSLVIQLGHIK